jgi:hypothetical protein
MQLVACPDHLSWDCRSTAQLMLAQLIVNSRASCSRIMSSSERRLQPLRRRKLGRIPARAGDELIERRLRLALDIDKAGFAGKARKPIGEGLELSNQLFDLIVGRMKF